MVRRIIYASFFFFHIPRTSAKTYDYNDFPFLFPLSVIAIPPFTFTLSENKHAAPNHLLDCSATFEEYTLTALGLGFLLVFFLRLWLSRLLLLGFHLYIVLPLLFILGGFG